MVLRNSRGILIPEAVVPPRDWRDMYSSQEGAFFGYPRPLLGERFPGLPPGRHTLRVEQSLPFAGVTLLSNEVTVGRFTRSSRIVWNGHGRPAMGMCARYCQCGDSHEAVPLSSWLNDEAHSANKASLVRPILGANNIGVRRILRTRIAAQCLAAGSRVPGDELGQPAEVASRQNNIWRPCISGNRDGHWSPIS